MQPKNAQGIAQVKEYAIIQQENVHVKIIMKKKIAHIKNVRKIARVTDYVQKKAYVNVGTILSERIVQIKSALIIATIMEYV